MVQLQNELNSRPAGITMDQLQQALGSRPPCLTLTQLQQELNSRPGGGGITMDQMTNLLLQMKAGLNIDLVRELDARRPTTPIPGIPLLPPPMLPSGVFTQLAAGAYYRGGPVQIEFRTAKGKLKVRNVVRFHLQQTRTGLQLVYLKPGKRQPRVRMVQNLAIDPVFAALVRYDRDNWYYPGSYFRRSKAKYPPQAGDEIGNYGWTGNMDTQVAGWYSSGHRAHIFEEKIGGKTYYRYGRGKGDWPWVIMHKNLVNILESLGVKDPIRGTGQGGRYEWGTMSENIINIAHALFGKREEDEFYDSE